MNNGSSFKAKNNKGYAWKFRVKVAPAHFKQKVFQADCTRYFIELGHLLQLSSVLRGITEILSILVADSAFGEVT